MKTKFTIFFLLFALCVNINTTNAQVNKQDSLALIDLYKNTNGSNWYNQRNWLTSSPVSTWYGITVTNNRVTELNITGNNLTGSIPSSVGHLVILPTWI